MPKSNRSTRRVMSLTSSNVTGAESGRWLGRSQAMMRK